MRPAGKEKRSVIASSSYVPRLFVSGYRALKPSAFHLRSPPVPYFDEVGCFPPHPAPAMPV